MQILNVLTLHLHPLSPRSPPHRTGPSGQHRGCGQRVQSISPRLPRYIRAAAPGITHDVRDMSENLCLTHRNEPASQGPYSATDTDGRAGGQDKRISESPADSSLEGKAQKYFSTKNSPDREIWTQTTTARGTPGTLEASCCTDLVTSEQQSVSWC